MILIIGAGSWLVQQIAAPLAEDYPVTLIGGWRPSKSDSQATGAENIFYQTTDYREVRPILKRCESESQVTIIFAGIGAGPSLLAELDMTEVRNIVDTHISFAIELASRVLPHMIRQRFGRFIFFGSSEGSRGVVGGATYTTVKSAHKGLSRSIAVEYGRFGITSNVIDLGYLGAGYADKLSPEVRLALDEQSRKLPPITPNDIVGTIRALIQNPGISGSVITVDGAR